MLLSVLPQGPRRIAESPRIERPRGVLKRGEIGACGPANSHIRGTPSFCLSS